MKRKNVKFELQGKVRKYLDYMFHKDFDSHKEFDTLNTLTNTLKRKLILDSYVKILARIPFFNKNFSEEVIEELALCLKELKFSPEELIYSVFYNIFL